MGVIRRKRCSIEIWTRIFRRVAKTTQELPDFDFQRIPSDTTKLAIYRSQAKWQKGGIARAAFYGPDWIREWGRLGGIETCARYGSEFYREIRTKRNYYKKKGYQTRKTKMRWQKECERRASEENNPGIAALWMATAKHFATEQVS